MISSFKIAGGKVITINIVDILKDDNPKDDSKFGEFNPANNVITIAKRVIVDGDSYVQTEEDMNRTLWHEIFHVFQFYAGFNMTEYEAQIYSNFMYEYLNTKK